MNWVPPRLEPTAEGYPVCTELGEGDLQVVWWLYTYTLHNLWTCIFFWKHAKPVRVLSRFFRMPRCYQCFEARLIWECVQNTIHNILRILCPYIIHTRRTWSWLVVFSDHQCIQLYTLQKHIPCHWWCNVHVKSWAHLCTFVRVTYICLEWLNRNE